MGRRSAVQSSNYVEGSSISLTVTANFFSILLHALCTDRKEIPQNMRTNARIGSLKYFYNKR